MTKTYQINNLEIVWFGHASFKIKTPKLVIYVDPYNVTSKEKADLILVTHSHFDHKDEKSIQALSKEGTEVLIGGENIQEGDDKQVKEVKVKAVPAYNLNKDFHPRGSGVGFIVEIDKIKIYHAGDTDAIPEMANLKSQQIDLALLPIGGTYTMNIKEAAEAVKMIKPKKVIPMHYNTFKEISAKPEEFKKLVDKVVEVIIL